MKKLTTIIPLSLFVITLFAQQDQDPQAKGILDKVKTQIESYQYISADFELTIKNKRENINTSSAGTIYLKDSLYAIESPGSKVVYDGKQLWTYTEDINEVTITAPSEEDSFTENPALIFSFYERDFKFRLRGTVTVDKKEMLKIDLYPKELNQPYSRYVLLINKATNTIYSVEAISKDGIDYIATIKSMNTTKELKKATFVFDTKNYPDIEVIDMRF